MNRLARAGVALAALAAIPAAAQQGPRTAEPLTRAALQGHVEARFAALDTDRDGYVTRAELEAKAEAHRARRAARRAALFARLDANGDGMISRVEFEARPTARGERGGKSGMRVGMRGHGGGGLMAGLGLRHFDALDADKDGRLSRAEATARAAAMFERVDANRDGVISSEERRAARAAMRGHRRGG